MNNCRSLLCLSALRTAAMVACLTCLIFCRPAPAAGGMVRMSWDFGFLPQKSVVSHTFYLKNTTAKSLTITEIKPGCSCTSVSEIKDAVPPGDSAAIRITFKSGRYYRRVRKSTGVRTDNPELPGFELEIKADVLRPQESSRGMKITPQRVVWTRPASKTSPPTDTLWIKNGLRDSMTVTVLATQDSIFSNRLAAEVIPPGDSTQLFLQLDRQSFLVKQDDLSLTLGFFGRENVRITIPIEIAD